MVALSYKVLLKNRILLCVVFPAFLLGIVLLSGTLSAKPLIVGPKIYGVRQNTPFLFPLGAINTGTSRTFSIISGLPTGLTLDPATGFLTGTAPANGRYLVKFKVSCTQGDDTATLDIRCGDTLAYVPPMGWSSWNFWNRCVDQDAIIKTAHFIAESGLRDLGYHYINIDDAWSTSNRDNNSDMVCRSTFNLGIKAIADSLHRLGLKLGLYSDVGTGTFEGGEGSYGYYEHDAKMFANWGVDYLKVDKAGGGSDYTTVKGLYTDFGTQLKNSGRTIMLSICEWGRLRPWEWGRQSYGSLWRCTWDLRDNWWSSSYNNGSCGMLNSYDSTHAKDTLWKYSGPGAWNDMDMMWVCMKTEMDQSTNRPKNNPYGGLTKIESMAHMSIWALFSSPLILSNDFSGKFTAPNPDTLMQILTHEEIIAINQDILGKQARIISDNGNLEIFSRPLADSSRAVGLLNRGTSTASMTVTWAQLNISGQYTVRDVWAREDKGEFSSSYTCDVAKHEVKVFKIYKKQAVPISNSYSDINSATGAPYTIETGLKTITIKSDECINAVEIMGLNGKTISSFDVSGMRIVTLDKAHLTNGIYLFKIVAGKKEFTAKVLINRK